VRALSAGGFVVSEADAGLFLKRTENGTVFLVTYVDDMIIACACLQEVIIVKQYLAGVFEVTDLGEVSHFLGNLIVRTAGSVRVSNPSKVKEILADYGIENPRKVLTPMDHSFVITQLAVVDGIQGGSGKPLEEGNRYNELIGSLMYLSSTTRPDITLAVGLLSRFRSSPTTSHWNAGMRVLSYLYQTQEMGLEYNGDHDIVGYVDSAFADDKDTLHSTMGYTFVLNGAAVSWGSKKQRTVATSTVEAEYVAFHEAAKEAIRLQQLLFEMLGRTGSITINCDSTGCIANLKNPIISSYIKHVDACYRAGREMVTHQKIVPQYIGTEDNVADVFTKPLVHVKFAKFRDGLGMT
jgi:histone deacetylase 1/2